MKMKNRIWNYAFVLGSILVLTTNCKKDMPVPIVTTSAVTNIGVNFATCGGNITTDNGQTVIGRGVCWSINPTPTVNDSKTIDGAGAGNFSSKITGLNLNSLYYVRAYATNSAGTGYGSVMSFNTTHVDLPTVTTGNYQNIKGNSAFVLGQVTNNGGSTIIQSGICWSTSPNPTIADSKTNSFSSNISPLSINTLYYVRAYATTIAGTGYGNQISFNSGYVIGSTFSGGIVFYNDSNAHGLVVTPNDLGPIEGAIWGCEGTVIGTSSGIGTGATNTSAIVARCSIAGTAARLCSDLVLNGYSDWYLPSIEELYLIYQNLYKEGLDFGYYSYYWSSTEGYYYYPNEPPDGHWAAGLRFSDGLKFYGKNKDSNLQVCAVRSF